MSVGITVTKMNRGVSGVTSVLIAVNVEMDLHLQAGLKHDRHYGFRC